MRKWRKWGQIYFLSLDPYEALLNPEVIVSTDRETVDESAAKVIRKLEDLGRLPR